VNWSTDLCPPDTQDITLLSLYKRNPLGTRTHEIERALEEQLPKNGHKHQSSLCLPNMSISDRVGAVLINSLQEYFPLTSLDLSG
jgi:hypothetical protein